MIVYEIVKAKQPEVIEELQRRRWLRWQPGGELESTVTIKGHTYRDVTREVAASGAARDKRMNHSSYRRINRRVRQVRQG